VTNQKLYGSAEAIESKKEARTELLKRPWKGPGQCSLEIAREALGSPNIAPTVCECTQETVDGVQETADGGSTLLKRNLVIEGSARSQILRSVIESVMATLFRGSNTSG
jgi:hypothetical protein